MLTIKSANLIGLDFLCNRLVEGFYHLKEGESTEELTKAIEEVVREFDSLKFPNNNLPMPNRRLSNSDAPLAVFNKYLTALGKKFNEETIDELIANLRYVVSDNPLDERVETAERLQRFFNGLGCCSFYAGGEQLRRIS